MNRTLKHECIAGISNDGRSGRKREEHRKKKLIKLFDEGLALDVGQFDRLKRASVSVRCLKLEELEQQTISFALTLVAPSTLFFRLSSRVGESDDIVVAASREKTKE